MIDWALSTKGIQINPKQELVTLHLSPDIHIIRSQTHIFLTIFDDLVCALEEERLVGRHLVEHHLLYGGLAAPVIKVVPNTSANHGPNTLQQTTCIQICSITPTVTPTSLSLTNLTSYSHPNISANQEDKSAKLQLLTPNSLSLILL